MVNVKIYGQPTSTYEYVKMMIKRIVESAGCKLEFEEIKGWEEIMNEKICSLPTIKVDSVLNMSLTEDKDINDFVKEVSHKILKVENFGSMKKILVPTDFSDAAVNALVYARNISSKLNSIIQLVHVYKPEAVHVDSMVIIDEKIEMLKRKQLEKFVNKINHSWSTANDKAYPIDGVFRVGFIVDELEEMCEDQEGDCLIIAASTGESGRMKKLFGSVTTKLAKTCKNPVLIVPPSTTYNKITDILYAIDDIEIDKKALPQLLDFAAMFEAKVHIVHVNIYTQDYPYIELYDLAQSTNAKVSMHFEAINGTKVAETLDDYASKHTIDVVSMATHERGFFADLFHKSITKEMAINTSVPLLVLHA